MNRPDLGFADAGELKRDGNRNGDGMGGRMMRQSRKSVWLTLNLTFMSLRHGFCFKEGSGTLEYGHWQNAERAKMTSTFFHFHFVFLSLCLKKKKKGGTNSDSCLFQIAHSELKDFDFDRLWRELYQTVPSSVSQAMSLFYSMFLLGVSSVILKTHLHQK